MKITLSENEIAHQLKKDTNSGWSWGGARALAEYLYQLDEETGEDSELDVVAIRCDFSEHSSLIDWATEYFGSASLAANEFSWDEDATDDAKGESVRDYIQNAGQLIEFDGGIIVSSF